jgi:hypothetical protein
MNTKQYAVIEVISPEKAQEYLDKSDGNKGRYKRKIIPSAVRDYSRDMENGDWVLTHQGIAFDCNDQLVDGHNRMQAIIESGATVEIIVWRNLSEVAVKYLDKGRNRTNSDRLQIPKRQAEALRFAAKHAYKTSPPTISQLEQIKNSVYGDVLENLILKTPTTIKTITSAPFICGVAYGEMTNQTPYAREQFSHIYEQNYDEMSSIVKAFNKQIHMNFVNAYEYDDLLTRCMWVFDENNRHKTQTGRLNSNLAKTLFYNLFNK